MNDKQPSLTQYLVICGLVGFACLVALPFLTMIGGI